MGVIAIWNAKLNTTLFSASSLNDQVTKNIHSKLNVLQIWIMTKTS